MGVAATLDQPAPAAGPAYSLNALRSVLSSDLAPIVDAIDEGRVYPEAVLRRLGALGAWRQHDPRGGRANLWATIKAMAAIGSVCGATAFLAWCQNTLVWYVANSDNATLRARFLEPVSSGVMLGGTGLSNPMKSFFGIEQLKLKASPAEGGYQVKGALPWVSNLGPDHLFGTIAAKTSAVGETVMVLADCAEQKLTLTPCKPFLGMDGTGTYALQFRDLGVPNDMILADPAKPFVLKIRAGFVLLQTGMGLGLIRDCAAIMRELRPQLGAINGYLEVQPEDVEARLEALEAEIEALAATPFDPSPAYWRRVIEARLATSELSLTASQAAMLHAGARGYLRSHRAQRRLREAYFVAIVTPATKQLRKMLALEASEADAPLRAGTTTARGAPPAPLAPSA